MGIVMAIFLGVAVWLHLLTRKMNSLTFKNKLLQKKNDLNLIEIANLKANLRRITNGKDKKTETN